MNILLNCRYEFSGILRYQVDFQMMEPDLDDLDGSFDFDDY